MGNRIRVLVCIAFAVFFAASSFAETGESLDQVRDPMPQDNPESLYDRGFVENIALLSSGERDYNIAVDYVGSTLWSRVRDVTIIGDYAVCAMNYGLQIIDVSDPGACPIVSRLYTGYGRKVAASGSHAYLLSNYMCTVIDITDMGNPFLVTTLDLPARVVSTAAAGDCLYVTLNDNTLKVIDVTDPANPEIVGSIGLVYMTGRLHVSGDYAYVAGGSYGLQIIRISIPESPQLIQRYVLPDKYTTGVCTKADFAYVCYNDNVADSCGFQILDISNPIIPMPRGSYAFAKSSEQSKNIYIEGDHVLLFCTRDGIRTVNVADPDNPVYESVTGASGDWLFASGERAVASSYTGATVVYDISSPTDPIKGAQIYHSIVDIALKDNYAFLVEEDIGLQIVDVSDPANPSVEATSVIGFTDEIEINGSFAYVVHGSDDLSVYDINDPLAPALIASYDIGEHVWAFDVQDGLACAGTDDSGAVLIDISDPYNPQKVGQYYIEGWTQTRAVTLLGNYLYIGFMNGEVHAVDISNPFSPVMTSTSAVMMNIWAIGAYGQLLYVNSGQEQLVIFDISVPDVLTRLSGEDVYFLGVKSSGDYTYFAREDGGVDIVDIYNPASPQLAMRHGTGSYRTNELILEDGLIYMADQIGFMILSVSFPEFVGGDADASGDTDIDDVVFLIDYIFSLGPAPTPVRAGDGDCSGNIDIDDVVYLIAYIFSAGPAPPDCWR